jgi:nitrate/TMAO reductase-like tetraheme cytochrome c subunit
VRKHWAKLVAVLGIIFLATILSTHHFVASSQPMELPDRNATNAQAEECAGCHEMRPEVLTWQVSAHDTFACTVCHLNKNTSDFVDKHQSHSYSQPVRTITPISNSVCLKCHAANRMVSPSGDLRIPHQQHLDAGVSCVTCHYGVVHGKIAERDLSYILPNLTDYDAWDLKIAQKVLTEYYAKPNMWTCINCHKERNVTRKCGACHTSIATLPSHDQASWGSDHGKSARNNLQLCIDCHATRDLTILAKSASGDRASDFARAQKFCYQCHLQRPEMHGRTIIPIHPNLVLQKGVQNCQTCHKEQKPRSDEQVSKIYCNQCHWFDS